MSGNRVDYPQDTNHMSFPNTEQEILVQSKANYELEEKLAWKATKTGRLDPRKLFQNAVQSMNNVNSQKYGVPPETVQKKSLED